jgi:signal transduction histidine kinase
LIEDAGTERLGRLAHALRNVLTTAELTFGALRSGRVGIAGSTGAALGRTLGMLRHIVSRSLTEVRLESGTARPARIDVAAFIEDVEIGAALGASDRGLALRVPVVPGGVAVHADEQLLSSAVGNLLHNAFKFTRKNGTVAIVVRRDDDRVRIEVHDECGGILADRLEDLFEPYVQGGADRSGVGLGLSISRRAVESQGGTLAVRNVDGTGCVFTIDLPAVV